jgi:hypothetical protein
LNSFFNKWGLILKKDNVPLVIEVKNGLVKKGYLHINNELMMNTVKKDSD